MPLPPLPSSYNWLHLAASEHSVKELALPGGPGLSLVWIFVCFAGLEMESRALGMLVTHSTIEPRPHPHPHPPQFWVYVRMLADHQHPPSLSQECPGYCYLQMLYSIGQFRIQTAEAR